MNSLSEVIAVLPAAGIGSRMQTACPKQYLMLRGKTILEHAIEILLYHPIVQRIIVVLNRQDDRFHSLPIAGNAKISVVHGGDQRADSVMAALRHVEKNAKKSMWVLVHDAARPCLHGDDLDLLLNIIGHSKIGGILATPVRDTMKRAIAPVAARATIAHTVERQQLWHALTPQFFPFELLKTCLSRAIDEKAEITDEAAALEYCGYYPQLINGRSDNIKVTYPEDLALAEFYLTYRDHQE
ncbi:2-C-methyl-D-erythritol 4-phosphate cytidylyltransferase [Candidatus Fukatsuia symbiotica]|uniref:2-C-methyl-D-erythritol 4-phosphate cytidylyltransferase n=1 Tax=Candidatus Fukatsuia symbiotica TaxID=1878942 RepID=A0A2U8I7P7_9GAMM|nr:2-C-methyl-D-erythritol 4-phosphate cytidylyltransferase [Candidatus Fukatsuia symbiotica]AWK15180.1 2-C-methyl-D-erythritol 4-phosphate cytidylyltransferase [Candidatus Fukatsuia symbiotica]MEA9444009.1 2-C-methyl-D-erythritol 4-phosphate cytidylyltransferase [Candidatus Fukatsuia symbiotica]